MGRVNFWAQGNYIPKIEFLEDCRQIHGPVPSPKVKTKILSFSCHGIYILAKTCCCGNHKSFHTLWLHFQW